MRRLVAALVLSGTLSVLLVPSTWAQGPWGGGWGGAWYGASGCCAMPGAGAMPGAAMGTTGTDGPSPMGMAGGAEMSTCCGYGGLGYSGLGGWGFLGLSLSTGRPVVRGGYGPPFGPPCWGGHYC